MRGKEVDWLGDFDDGGKMPSHLLIFHALSFYATELVYLWEYDHTKASIAERLTVTKTMCTILKKMTLSSKERDEVAFLLRGVYRGCEDHEQAHSKKAAAEIKQVLDQFEKEREQELKATTSSD